ncbi:TetR/AcrR family transcriptional regulator [Oerskovia flava]|uniref:TetR/AcrR family transcriptional regulator n=1 Tax=Oerskovia flava TaxID=2986422 RepID=UPI00223FE175|nr:TetR/AcrR family transcriptional regulator [Oerskovia sp. JB1-3-2]
MPEPSPDRRAALRSRYRNAIVTAAAALMDERDGAHFTVDELADRADVSRRTVFNHFASVDDVVTAVCSDRLGAVVDALESATSASVAASTADDDASSAMFEEVADALRSTDLVAPMSYLTRVLGAEGSAPSAHQAVLLLHSFTLLSERLAAAMLRRHPGADELTVHLLVGGLVSGLIVIHRHWWALTGGGDDPASRRTWDQLLEQLLETSRHGHGSARTTPPTRPRPKDPHG